MAREVSVSQLRRLAGRDLAERTDQALSNDNLGVALYNGDRTDVRCVVSFGGPGADLPIHLPPSHFGDLLLDAYVMPEPVKPTMRSPLMNWEQPPQIPDRPRRGQAETLYPEVHIETRQRREPRPPSDPSRYLLPGREEEEARPARLERWW
jgi:hypothetical protein